MDTDKYFKAKELLQKYESLLSKEETFWRQKSREIWLSKGEKNSKYFHNNTKIKRNIKIILKIKSMRGGVIDNPIELCKEFV